MPLFYRGVAAGSHHSTMDYRLTGLTPRHPGTKGGLQAMMSHITHGATHSPYMSLTRSYSIAEGYAYTGVVPPSRTSPGYVYEIQIDPRPPQGLALMDPVCVVADANRDPYTHHSYHHKGDRNFLLGLVNPSSMGAVLLTPAGNQPQSARTPSAPGVSIDLEALVRALRDAEILAVGAIPSSCFVNRHEVY